MFITFEGIDACGKSTCIKKIKDYIEKNLNINDFVFTREPGGFNIKECEEIRKILLDKTNDIDPMSEMLLFLTSRIIHVNKLIKPSINNRKIVISDRFFDSSIAYQGSGREIGVEKVENLNLETLNGFKPDFTFYLKIDLETSIKRSKYSQRNLDRLEQEKEDFFKKVIEGYEYIVKKNNERFIVIDATKDIDDVFEQVLENFKKIIQKFYSI